MFMPSRNIYIMQYKIRLIKKNKKEQSLSIVTLFFLFKIWLAFAFVFLDRYSNTKRSGSDHKYKEEATTKNWLTFHLLRFTLIN